MGTYFINLMLSRNNFLVIFSESYNQKSSKERTNERTTKFHCKSSVVSSKRAYCVFVVKYGQFSFFNVHLQKKTLRKVNKSQPLQNGGTNVFKPELRGRHTIASATIATVGSTEKLPAAPNVNIAPYCNQLRCKCFCS